jgi:hypothetical protein
LELDVVAGAVPIFGPVVLSLAFIGLWSTGDPAFVPDYANAIAEVTPWALIFYSIALLGSTLHAFWPILNRYAVLGTVMIVEAIAVCVYAGFIAVWRHDLAFQPGVGVYATTVILLVATVSTCHLGYAIKVREP